MNQRAVPSGRCARPSAARATRGASPEGIQRRTVRHSVAKCSQLLRRRSYFCSPSRPAASQTCGGWRVQGLIRERLVHEGPGAGRWARAMSGRNGGLSDDRPLAPAAAAARWAGPPPTSCQRTTAPRACGPTRRRCCHSALPCVVHIGILHTKRNGLGEIGSAAPRLSGPPPPPLDSGAPTPRTARPRRHRRSTRGRSRRGSRASARRRCLAMGGEIICMCHRILHSCVKNQFDSPRRTSRAAGK
jgi:hypothetical protein